MQTMVKSANEKINHSDFSNLCQWENVCCMGRPIPGWPPPKLHIPIVCVNVITETKVISSQDFKKDKVCDCVIDWEWETERETERESLIEMNTPRWVQNGITYVIAF